MGRWEYPNYPIIEPEPGKTFFFGRDYLNSRVKEIDNLHEWEKDLIDRKTIPRVAWRDIHSRFKGPIVNRIKRHFIQYWNFVNIPFAYNNLLIKPPTDEGTELKKFSQYFKTKYFPDMAELKKNEMTESESRPGIALTCRKHADTQSSNGVIEVQAIRSASYWSIGLEIKNPEFSIRTAYLDLIKNAKHFIYIENQYLISQTDDKEIENQVINALAAKVIEKIRAGERFSVYLVHPLIAGFDGDLSKPNGVLPRRGTDIIYKTLYKSEKSLIKQVMKFDLNWEKYIKIYSLKNHGLLNDVPVAEIVYVHSKLMIVDDDIALLGSANINDRSLLGTRDSEVGVVVTDSNKIQGQLAGKAFPKSSVVQDLRIRAWRTIFGVSKPVSWEDPLDEDLQNAIAVQANINDQFYWDVFGSYPSNNIKFFRDIAPSIRKIHKEQYLQNREKVKGIAVPWPYLFLDSENIEHYDKLAPEVVLAPKILLT